MALTTQESVATVRDIGAHEVLLVVPCSESHFGHVYGGGFEQLCTQLSQSITTARALGLDINVGLEDASQRDGALMSRILHALRPHLPSITSFTIADTRGQLLGPEVEVLIEDVRQLLSPMRPVAFHAHNDLGLAVANSLTALSMHPSVECVQVTMCGLGERAGNASLEQVAVLLETKLARKTGINLAGLAGLARFVEDIFLTPIHPHQPVVGGKVFLHESGLHQKGMLSDDTTYQFLDPGRFGRESDLVLGKHSGDSGCGVGWLPTPAAPRPRSSSSKPSWRPQTNARGEPPSGSVLTSWPGTRSSVSAAATPLASSSSAGRRRPALVVVDGLATHELIE